MIFNFHNILDYMTSNPQKQPLLSRYASTFGRIPERLEDFSFYSFLSGFTPVQYHRGEIERTDRDAGLLLQFIAASHAVNYWFNFYDQALPVPGLSIYGPDMYRGINHFVVQDVDKLDTFSMLKYFEYFMEEQISRHLLMYTDPETKELIENERETKHKEYLEWMIKIKIHEIGRKSRILLNEKFGDFGRLTF